MNEAMAESGMGKLVLILRARSSLRSRGGNSNNERSDNLSLLRSLHTKIAGISYLG
jgi:hypothetical protein